MRHSIRHRPHVEGVTPRHLSAANRALNKERNQYTLFAEQLTQETAEETISRHDAVLLANDQEHRDLAAEFWRKGRRLGHVYPELLDEWNRSTIPPDAHCFAEFIQGKVRGHLRQVVEAGFTGAVVCGLMRMFRRTIRDLSKDMGITMKRIREVRSEGLSDRMAIRDWIEGITGVDPGEV